MQEDPRQAFSDGDRDQLLRHGLDQEDAARQLELLRDTVSRFRTLDRPVRPGDGIRKLEPRMAADLLATAVEVRSRGRVSKFVPASGAATRMFQSLLRALDEHERGTMEEGSRIEVARFFEAIPQLALRHDLHRSGIAPDDLAPRTDADRARLLHRILSDTEAGLASRPKGLVPFHDEGSRGCTAFEEHLREAILYTADAEGVARAHFTLPDNKREAFEALLGDVRGSLEGSSGAQLDVTFSSQMSSTDTISLGNDGAPFRGDDGRLLFRPGGHGALLQNLQNTGGDIVVIKNIDNVVPRHRVREIVYWQGVLVGYLATLQQSIHTYLREIHEDGTEPHWLEQALVFAERHLSIHVPSAIHHENVAEKRDFLVKVLDRPIRVCAMVRNEGEPGGGPFWVRNAKGSTSLQIVESAEVDLDDDEQVEVWKASTHFNPVDLVVGLRDWKGKRFDLARFTDPKAVFRASKSSGGRPLIALERPGLWNGAMANWTTVFVEVPLSTFAPVKTIFDLLRPEHK